MTPKKKRTLYAHQKGLCFYCGKKMDTKAKHGYHNSVTVEHLIPKVYYKNRPEHEQGFDNTVLACYSCNCSRGYMPLKHFVQELHGKLN